jgi:hypothetical protein
MEHLIRLDVLAVTRFSDSTDVARLTVLASDLTQRGFSRASAVTVLILDFAARSPGLTSAFIETLDRTVSQGKRRRVDGCELPGLYRDLHESKSWRSYWMGPMRLNMTSFVKHASIEALELIAQRITSAERVRVREIMEQVTSERFVNSYAGFCMLRCVAAAVGVRLRACNEEAQGMSLHTSLLSELMPFDYARKALKPKCGHSVPDGMMAFLYCETVKLLRHEGILEALSVYENDGEAFAEALADTRTSAFLTRMADMMPATDTEPSETEEVKETLPVLSKHKHTVQKTISRWKRCTKAASR